MWLCWTDEGVLLNWGIILIHPMAYSIKMTIHWNNQHSSFATHIDRPYTQIAKTLACISVRHWSNAFVSIRNTLLCGYKFINTAYIMQYHYSPTSSTVPLGPVLVVYTYIKYVGTLQQGCLKAYEAITLNRASEVCLSRVSRGMF